MKKKATKSKASKTGKSKAKPASKAKKKVSSADLKKMRGGGSTGLKLTSEHGVREKSMQELPDLGSYFYS